MVTRTSTPPAPLDDSLLVAQWLSEITGAERADVVRRLINETKYIGYNVAEAGRNFGLEPHVWNERMLEFYRTTDAFLYETVTWNATDLKRSLQERMCQMLSQRLPTGATILCYGDGMGFDGAALARRGFRVTSYEVSAQCLEFARRMCQLHELNVEVEPCEEKLAGRKFDAIVCLDVLEHVPDPLATVRKFSEHLQENGYLLVNAPYYAVDETRPTHLKCNRRYAGIVNGLYGQAGFAPVEAALGLSPLLLRKGLGSQPSLTYGQTLHLRLAQLVAWIPKHMVIAPRIASRLIKPPRAWRHALGQAAVM